MVATQQCGKIYAWWLHNDSCGYIMMHQSFMHGGYIMIHVCGYIMIHQNFMHGGYIMIHVVT